MNNIYAARRSALLNALPEGSVVLLRAASEARRNNDVYYPFRQNSYFWYFTGFPEANAVAVLSKKNNTLHYLLYSAARNPLHEIWEGKIIGQEGALRDYGVDEALPLSDLPQLEQKLGDCKHLYVVLGDDAAHDAANLALLQALHQQAGRGGAGISGLHDVRALAAEMRLIKSAEELQILEQAVAISATGHRAAMEALRHAKYEYQLQAALEAAFREQGCGWSFPSIIANGSNACCLHYRNNNEALRDGDLVLVDAGAEWGLYAGDLTRTFPVNGRFNKQQQALYEVVLAAEKTGIAAAKTGIRHRELHEQVAKVLIQGVLDLGLYAGNMDDWLENDRYKRFYPHGTGHWLGLDVHDVGTYLVDGQSRMYQENMVITIEPGLYIQLGDEEVKPEWRGIGIRIEDDVVVTAQGGRVLNADAAPKEVAEIEALLAGR